MTLVDLADGMLAVSRQLNPECEHHQGDMRTVRLGRMFDAVFVHDAVDYMVTEDDLGRAIETAFVHCRPGGVAVFIPDQITETFVPATDHEPVDDGADGRAVRFLDWSWDPDPTDTSIATEYAFLLRSADGAIEVVHETHHLGLFGRAVAAPARRRRFRARGGHRGDDGGPAAAPAVPCPPASAMKA
jgi:trans-aconitate methyltransferase